MRAPPPCAAEQPAPPRAGRGAFASAVFLGVRISRVSRADVVRFVTESAAARRKALVNNVNVHAMNIARADARFAEALNESDVVFCDGAGVKVLARLAGVRLGERMTPPDWIDALFEECDRKGLSLFFLGDEEGVVSAFASEVERRHPGVRIAGFHHGFFDAKGPENRRIVALINGSAPDVIITGMGMPRQELWAHDNKAALHAGVVVSAGALFRVYAGLASRCPGWLGRHGLEWTWRLAHEPRRLFARYVLGNPAFLARVLYSACLKRPAELAAASGLFLAALPLLAVCWVLVRLSHGGPAIFTHQRVGKDGRPFRMYKFRTLPQDFPAYVPKRRVEAARLTTIARFLRRTALDELPQLVNVIKGDMALVGPRPEMPFVAAGYGERERLRLGVRPGATGPWQVARLRGEVDGRAIHEDLRYDLDYLRRVGPLVDLAILAQTAVSMAVLPFRKAPGTLPHALAARESPPQPP